MSSSRVPQPILDASDPSLRIALSFLALGLGRPASVNRTVDCKSTVQELAFSLDRAGQVVASWASSNVAAKGGAVFIAVLALELPSSDAGRPNGAILVEPERLVTVGCQGAHHLAQSLHGVAAQVAEGASSLVLHEAATKAQLSPSLRGPEFHSRGQPRPTHNGAAANESRMRERNRKRLGQGPCALVSSSACARAGGRSVSIAATSGSSQVLVHNAVASPQVPSCATRRGSR
eukprot:scaffold874_cov380-Prasinococcus_capsulatus_cf.AAC.17